MDYIAIIHTFITIMGIIFLAVAEVGSYQFFHEKSWQGGCSLKSAWLLSMVIGIIGASAMSVFWYWTR